MWIGKELQRDCKEIPRREEIGKRILPWRYKEEDRKNEENIDTLNSAYNEKKCAKILLHYRQLFVKGDVFIGVCSIFGADIFLRYSRFFIKGDFVIGGVECSSDLD